MNMIRVSKKKMNIFMIWISKFIKTIFFSYQSFLIWKVMFI